MEKYFGALVDEKLSVHLQPMESIEPWTASKAMGPALGEGGQLSPSSLLSGETPVEMLHPDIESPA